MCLTGKVSVLGVWIWRIGRPKRVGDADLLGSVSDVGRN